MKPGELSPYGWLSTGERDTRDRAERRSPIRSPAPAPLTLFMVPGLVSHLDIQWQQAGYRRFVRALERGGRLIRLDKRGTGLSDPAAEPADDAGAGAGRGRGHDRREIIACRAVRVVRRRTGRDSLRCGLSRPDAGLILYGTSYRGPRAALLRRYRSVVRHWGEGRLIDLVAPSLAGPAGAPGGGGVRAGGGQPGHGGGSDRVAGADRCAGPDEWPGGSGAGIAPRRGHHPGRGCPHGGRPDSRARP